MLYIGGNKYTVVEDFFVKTEVYGFEIDDELSSLGKDGLLLIKRWFSWDGDSGPAIDLKKSRKASCVHDILCGYVQDKLLPEYLQPQIDQEYYKLCVEGGMAEHWARLRMIALRWYLTGHRLRKRRVQYVK